MNPLFALTLSSFDWTHVALTIGGALATWLAMRKPPPTPVPVPAPAPEPNPSSPRPNAPADPIDIKKLLDLLLKLLNAQPPASSAESTADASAAMIASAGATNPLLLDMLSKAHARIESMQVALLAQRQTPTGPAAKQDGS